MPLHFSLSPVANPELAARLRHRIDRKTKPVGALGQLEDVAFQLGMIQGRDVPVLTDPQLIVFAGDHGAAKAGVSAYPQDVTWQMVENFLAGGAAINVFARTHGIGLKIMDCGVAHDFGPRPGLINAKISAGTHNYLECPAMTASERDRAMTEGARVVRQLAREGCNVVGFGEMGIGNTASASLITHLLCGAPLAECVGRGTGLDDAGLVRKQALLAKAAERLRFSGADTEDPRVVLAEVGGLEIAAMVGAMLAAAEARMLVLVDGFIVGAAALVAARIDPIFRDYALFCHCSAEPGARVVMEAFQARPLLDLGLRLGEGTGAALAWPLVQAAAAFLNEMASFESAGVADKL